MKSTNSIAKHRFFVILSCVALAALWYCFVVMLMLFFSRLDLSMIDGDFALYSWFQLLFGPVMIGLASLLTLPFAVVVFKRLKVLRPRLSAIALSTSFFFAFCLFALILDIFAYTMYQYPVAIWVVMGISALISVVLYWLIVRKLSFKLSRAWTLIIIVTLPVAVLLVDILYRLFMYVV